MNRRCLLGRCLSFVPMAAVGLLGVLGVAKNSTCNADRLVSSQVLGLERTSSHPSQGQRKTELSEALKVEGFEKEVLQSSALEVRVDVREFQQGRRKPTVDGPRG